MVINDLDILDIFIGKNGKLSTKRLGKQWLTSHFDIYEYLLNRYQDSESNIETIYRIKNNMEIRPVCKTCGKHINFIDFKNGFRQYCCSKCSAISQETRKKYLNTCNEKYGGIYNPDRSRETLLNRYGVDNYSKTKEFKIKYENTCLDKYGVKNTFLLESSLNAKLEKYGTLFPSQSSICKEKSKLTCLEKYGVEYSFQSENNKLKSKETKTLKYNDPYFCNHEKVVNTLYEKYGVENPMWNDEFKTKYKSSLYANYNVYVPMKNEIIKETQKETCLINWGYDNPAKSPEIKEKIKNTNIEIYGYPCPLLNDNILEKSILTCIEKYGVPSFSSSNSYKEKQSILMSCVEMQLKINETKKEHNSFNSSKIEDQFEQYLKENNYNYIRQYRSDVYPFNCDFYLSDYDLYIEIQGSWTHGKHPFNIEDTSDVELVNKWRQKNTRYYDNAIKTWTVRDVHKREVAKQNKINYLEIFSCNLLNCVDMLKQKING